MYRFKNEYSIVRYNYGYINSLLRQAYTYLVALYVVSMEILNISDKYVNTHIYTKNCIIYNLTKHGHMRLVGRLYLQARRTECKCW